MPKSVRFRASCLLLAAAVLLVGCSLFPTSGSTPTASLAPDQPAATSQPGTPEPAVPSSLQTPLPVVETPLSKLTLVIWLPAEFAPADDSLAGRILSQRLQSFQAEHPEVRLDVRLKALEGVGGLLDSLSTASVAAPLALPDLVALPRPLLESAALKGLLRPFDDLTSVQSASDWYPYARDLSRLQQSTFGLPFAGDALLLVYYPGSTLEPPVTWGVTNAISGTLSFPAADPHALFTLSLYLAAGGAIQDSQGRPMIDPDILVQVLDFYSQAEQAGSLPYWLVQYETTAQAWDAFTQRQAQQALGWSSRYLPQAALQPGSLQAVLLPAPDQTGFTLATGWLWALPATQPERQELSAMLAEYLVEGAFLAEWSAALGYLPTRSTALQSWQPAELRLFVEQLSLSARPYPPADVMSSLGPALKQATLDVLTRQQAPLDAAQQAAAALK